MSKPEPAMPIRTEAVSLHAARRSGRPPGAIAYGPLAVAATLAAVCIASATPAHAADGCVDVEVQNVRAGLGPVMVAVYDGEAGFGKQPAVSQQLRAPAEATTLKATLCGLAGASVAVTLFQDLNGNGRLDANVLGIPSEPWGASGRVTPMAAPSWASARVPLDGKPVVVPLSK